ncbi:uncharacterized protein LOC113280419 [Papaver somniferum]|uniref:uncharacterized protein LOC113280419 n=1 Tax=Papaver somniferum TaxID=3469 RepID=UPI000E6FA48A|nr:uncharacterized protein LOC113280419 [Papaver somniferum]
MYVLNGRGRAYDTFVISAQNRETPYTFDELKARLLTREQWLGAQNQDYGSILDNPSTFYGRNFTTDGAGSTSSSAYASDGGSTSRPFVDFSTAECQICRKTGHYATRYFFRYHPSPSSESKSTANVAQVETAYSSMTINSADLCDDPSGGSTSTTCISNSGASRHMTGDKDLLQDTSNYHGKDKIIFGNGKTLQISQTVSSILHTPEASFELKHAILVPEIKQNLLSVAQFTKDNFFYFDFDPWSFEIGYLSSHALLAKGKMVNNLYPVSHISVNKNALFTSYSSTISYSSL